MLSKTCAARTCFNTSTTRPDLKFFAFPKVKSYTQLWAKACNRLDLTKQHIELLSEYVLCAEHFEDHWFLNPKTRTAFITNKIPIPTLFRNNFKEGTVQRRSLKVLGDNTGAMKDAMDFTTDIKSEITDEEEKFQFELDTSQVHSLSDDDEELALSLTTNDIDIQDAQRSLHKFCRLCACLISAELLTSIYDTRFDVKINKLLPHEVRSFKNDGLPEEVCKSCIGKLFMCENIIQQFIHADQKLRNLRKLQEMENNISLSPPNVSSFLELQLIEDNSVKEEPKESIPPSNIIHLIGINTSSTAMKILQKDLKNDVRKIYRIMTVDETNTSIPLKEEISNDLNLDLQQDSHREVESSVFQTQCKADDPEGRTESSSQFDVNKLTEATIFKCIDCGEEYSNKNSILAHSLKAHVTLQNSNHKVRYCVMRKKKKKQMIVEEEGTKSYKCTACNSEFFTKGTLQAHLKTHLPGSNAYEGYGKYFVQKNRLKSHRKLHVNEKPYRCGICGESFIFSNSYRRHRQSHVKLETSRHCDKCDETFTTASLLKKHEKMHGEQTGYLCSLCGKLLTTMNTFRSHLTTHYDERPFSCANCSKTFKTSSQLSHHSKTHQKEKKFECNDCKKQFRVKTLLKQHMNVHSGMKPYVCDVCGARFNRHGNLSQHKKKHAEIEEPVIKCEVCNKRQRSLFALTYHMSKHTGEKRPYSCDICQKRFVSIAQWRVHQRFHTGERPYVCSACGRPFRSESTMKQHYAALHTDTFPHKCPYCEREFKRLHSLNVHKKTHTGERPYPCPICGRAFAQKGDMMKHTKVHTQPKPRRSSGKKKNYFKILEPVVEETVIQDVETDPATILTLTDADMTNDFLLGVTSVKEEIELA